MNAYTQKDDSARQQARQWEADFTAALSSASRSTPGLLFRIPPGQSLPSLRWEGDARGAYWASAGLVQGTSGNLPQVAARLHYLREPADEDGPFERDEYPLSTLNVGTSDPGAVAAIVVAAAKHHRTALSASDATEK